MTIIQDIDFSALYKAHIAQAQRAPKQSADWDEKAEKMQATQFDLNNGYAQDFVCRMALSPTDTLLDVGCGGGAIALTAAPHVAQVYALDYSQGMLNLLQSRMAQQGIQNIQPMLRAWDEPWDDVPPCDICVSSRSSMVNDLQAALDKLNAKARKAVYMTMTVDKDFIDRRVLQAIGRDGAGFPTYIYAVNMLYQQGYRVRVDFMESAAGMVAPSAVVNEASFLRSVQWSVGSDLTETEVRKLKDLFHHHQGETLVRPAQKTWAFLSWEK